MKVFTTGQVAKICKVAPRTVSKWFDSGRLKGYRIPGSQDRRIPREYLIKFLKEHGMPLGDLEDEAMAKVLIVAQDQVLIENLKRELPVERSFRTSTAASGFEAGIQAESFHPDCIIVDFSICQLEARAITFAPVAIPARRSARSAPRCARSTRRCPSKDYARWTTSSTARSPPSACSRCWQPRSLRWPCCSRWSASTA